jgi:hypothetical protein
MQTWKNAALNAKNELRWNFFGNRRKPLNIIDLTGFIVRNAAETLCGMQIGRNAALNAKNEVKWKFI